jgi:hypothetical protein
VIQGADEVAFVEAMCRGARDTKTNGYTRTVNAIFNVFAISNFTNTYPVFVGTLTLGNTGSALAYDANPQDHLVVVSPTETVEYFYQQFDGDGNGISAFIDSHAALVVRVVKANAYDFTITSSAAPGGSRRRYQGSIVLERSTVQVDVIESDGNLFDFTAQIAYPTGADFAGLTFFSASSLQGTVLAAGGTIDVSEVFDSRFVNTVQQTKIFVSSTGQRNGANYAMGNVYFQQVERDGLPSEPDFWLATGQLFRGDSAIGDAQFINSANPITDPARKRAMVLVDGTAIGM